MLMTEKLRQLVIRSERARENAQEKAMLAREADKLERNAWDICDALDKELHKEIVETGLPLVGGNCVVRVSGVDYLINVYSDSSTSVHKITIQE